MGLSTRLGVMFFSRSIGHGRHECLDLVVLQGGLSILQAKAESKAFFIRFETRTSIFIKQNNGLHNASGWICSDLGIKRVQQILCRNSLLDDQCQVARRARELRNLFVLWQWPLL